MQSVGRFTTPLQSFALAPLQPTGPRCERVNAHKAAQGLLQANESPAQLRITKVSVADLTVHGLPLGKVKVAVDEATGLAYAMKKYRLRDRNLAAKRRESPERTAAYVTGKLLDEGMLGARTGSALAISKLWVTDTHVYGQMPLMLGDLSAAHVKGLWGPSTPHTAPTRNEALAMRSVLMDLERLHARGYAHCDVKPANIMHREKPETALLGDFTLTRALSDRRPAPGTPYHMAPEQQVAKAAWRPVMDWARADVWGVGLSFMEIIIANPFACARVERQQRLDSYARWHRVKATPTRNPLKRLQAHNLAYASLFKNTFGQLEPAWRAFFFRLLDPNPTTRPDATAARRLLDGMLGL